MFAKLHNMAVNSLGMVLFPLLGGLLVVSSWRYPFFLSAVAIPIALYNQFFLNYSEKLTDLDTGKYLKNLLRSFTDRRVMLAAYLNFSSFIMMGGAFLSFYALYLTQVFPASIESLGFKFQREIFIGLAMSVFSGMVGVVAFRLGAIHARFGFHRVLAFAYVTYAGAF